MTTPDASQLGVLDLRFRTALDRISAAGRLTTVSRPVDTHLELAGLMKRHDGAAAMLFEGVTGNPMPVLGNFLASPANVEAAFGLDRNGIRDAMTRAMSSPLAPEIVTSAPSQEVIITSDIDLGELFPVLHHAPTDSGRFITSGVVVVRDPETGVPNASYHRLQLLGGNRTAIKMDYGRHLRAAHDRAIALGQDLHVAVCLGPDISLMYAAAFMGSQMPENADELQAAGGIQGSPLQMVRAITSDMLVPAECEIVLEARISPTETTHEGPFAEFIGYESDDGPAPVMTVDAVTHRRDPIYFAINGAGRETVMLRKYVLEASALRALKAAVPIVSDVELTAGGLYRFHILIQVAKRTRQHDGLQRNAILAAFGALKDLDHAIVVDDDVDLADGAQVEWAIATRFEASRDIILIPGARGHEYVRVSDRGQRTKMGLDATVPFDDQPRFARAAFSNVSLSPGDYTTAAARTFTPPS